MTILNTMTILKEGDIIEHGDVKLVVCKTEQSEVTSRNDCLQCYFCDIPDQCFACFMDLKNIRSDLMGERCSTLIGFGFHFKKVE